MRLALVIFLALAALPARARGAEPFDPFHQAGIDGKPGLSVPMDIAFQDQAGKTVTLRQLGRGRPILLIPVQHRCPNICGLTLDGVARALNSQAKQPGVDFELIAFGIDPAEGRDAAALSVAHLREALAGRPDKGVYGLTGGAAQIAAVTKALGYRYAWNPTLKQYAHIAATAVLTPDGRLTTWLYGAQPPPDVLKTALAAAAQGGIGGLGERLLLLCYHYDPQTGRYGPLTLTLLRVGSGLVVALLAGFIGLSLLLERRRRRRREHAA